MRYNFTDEAWEEYTSWQEKDKKTLKKINALLKEIARTPFEGSGSPEPLKFNLSGFWSRRISKKDRLVYSVENNEIIIISCASHYSDR
ncbi:MAG: toxin YoeB [Gammaproteobacteria bacterium]|jgi:toxin YoeB|nr:toxin YoeB [Gammaproteobacteria bacterium]